MIRVDTIATLVLRGGGGQNLSQIGGMYLMCGSLEFKYFNFLVG